VGRAARHPQEPAGHGLDPPVTQLRLELAAQHIERLVDRVVPVQDGTRLPPSQGELTGAEPPAGVTGQRLERQDGVVTAGLASGEHIGCGPVLHSLSFVGPSPNAVGLL
jgi:hypothetical protein